MKIGAIITGDIVDSTKMTAEERVSMLQLLQYLPVVLSPLDKMDIDIFRGDSFQIKVAEPSKVLRIAILIRAIFRANKFTDNKAQWDARMAIGIGSLDYESDTISTSDGEAYRLSGRGLDTIGKARISIETPWEDVNKELMVSTLFADDIMTGWTTSQSRIMFERLIKVQSQEEIGDVLGVSRQMVSKALKAAKDELISIYIKRFEELINQKTK